MAEPKTKKTQADVAQFIAAVSGAERQKDARALAALMQRVTKAEPKMWGKSIVGFGSDRLRYASGREVDWFQLGFSPRAKDLVIYTMGEIERLEPLLRKLGKHSTGKGCLYLRSIADVDPKVLEAVLREAIAWAAPPAKKKAAPAKKKAVPAKKTTAR